ncbi:MAG: chemotaxis protein CheW [Alphaproteobacteria bacterium]|nr:chemotaxis protein CheW [Alphaproteobacteria bacterium]
MSLYLRICVGDGLFLLDIAHVIEIRRARSLRGAPERMVDLRRLCGAPVLAEPSCIVVRQEDGRAALLLADRTQELIELSDDELSPLPPIGELGELIDAVTVAAIQERPALRLRGERLLDAIAAKGASLG